ncbi:MAG TPA: flagellar basal body rod protein FlgC [Candidatus Gastranaerophilales bacterium]|nr:flagellar basal body rod protein FlgC [Candidatus Gastranaerophilales bacterium]
MNFNALDISSSALHAQRVKMDTIASNIANINTTKNPDGTHGVYRRKQAIFATIYNDKAAQNNSADNGDEIKKNKGNFLKGGVEENVGLVSSGVKVLEVSEDYSTPLKKVYNPSHPDADKNGYVELPNVNIVNEMVDMISASRAYEANVTTIKASKSMISAAMKI